MYLLLLIIALPSILATPTQLLADEKVNVALFYESMCPGSKSYFYSMYAPLLVKLGPYLNATTNPYGFSKTIVNPNGTITFECQHGPSECYANMMHACAITHLDNIKYVEVIACLIKEGYDEETLTKCGVIFDIDTSDVRICIRDPQVASKVLAAFGKVFPNVPYVPYPTVNGKSVDINQSYDDYEKAVCALFKHKPSPCSHHVY